jgi:hypothetical protein
MREGDEMVLRWIVLIIGVLVLLLGVSQIFWASWWLSILPSVMALQTLRILGIVALVIGVTLTLAAARRAVGLRILVYILGLLMLISGIALVIDPMFMKNTVYSFFLNKEPGPQMMLTRIGGVIRALIGAALIYAAARPARRTNV